MSGCCPGGGFINGGAPADASAFSYELDFSAQGNIILADGPHTIDGRTWTAINNAGADSFRLTSGVGLNINLNATNTTFASTSPTAPLLQIELGDLLPNDQDVTSRWLFELFISAATLPASAEIYLGLYCVAGGVPAGNDGVYNVLAKLNSAGTIGLRSKSAGGTSSLRADAVATAANVLVLRPDSWGVDMPFSDQGAWPQRYTVSRGSSLRSVANPGQSMLDAEIRLAIGVGSNGVAGTTTDITFQRLRVRRIG